MASTTPHKARKDALGVAVTFNQIRNSIGIITELMEETYKTHGGASDEAIASRLRDMGRRIATTFSRYWVPEYQGVDGMLIAMYKVMLGSNVAVEQPADRQTTRKDFVGKKVFDVIDGNCPMCKGKRSTNIGGCELVLGVMEGMFKELHATTPSLDVPLLQAESVLESRTRGDAQCKHRYVLGR